MEKITISISDRAYRYLSGATENRSKFINDLIEKQEQTDFEQRLEQAYIDQEQDPEFHIENQLWECTVSDGLDDSVEGMVRETPQWNDEDSYNLVNYEQENA
jgi:predicted CopG family antitoxin